MVVDAGGIDAKYQRFRITPTGTFRSPEEIGELTFAANLATSAVDGTEQVPVLPQCRQVARRGFDNSSS